MSECLEVFSSLLSDVWLFGLGWVGSGRGLEGRSLLMS
jgi:hypothetical protein